jgi:Cu/Ag efflux protein CusF
MAMRRRFALVVIGMLAAACDTGPRYVGVGDVVELDPQSRRVTIRHDRIVGLTDAAVTRFAAPADDVRAALTPGARVRFEVRRRDGELVVVRANALARGNPGLHDHTPHHGGIVAMAGMLHLEAKASPDGLVQLYLTDVWRRPLPLDDVRGDVTLDLADGKRTLPLTLAGDVLQAQSPLLTMPAVNAAFALRRAGQAVDVNFLLPLDRRDSGAAGIPRNGCAASPEEDRCTLTFAKPVVAVALSPDAARLLVAQVDFGISAWRLPAAEFALGFAPPPAVPVPAGEAPHPEAPNAIVVRPDGGEAAVAMENRLIVYSMSDGRVLRSFDGPGGIVRAVAWSPDGDAMLVARFYDSTAYLLDAADGRVRHRLPVEREAAAVAFATDGRTVAVASELGAITLFDADTAAPGATLSVARGPVRFLGFAKEQLVAAGDDGTLRIWNPRDGAVLLERPLGRGVRAMVLNPEFDLVAAAGLDPQIQLIKLPSGEPLDTLTAGPEQVLSLAWVGSTLVSGDTAGRVSIWTLP